MRQKRRFRKNLLQGMVCLLVFMIAAFALWSFAVLYTSFDHNPQGEMCEAVQEARWYTLSLDGQPCVLTKYSITIIGILASILIILSGLLYTSLRLLRKYN